MIRLARPRRPREPTIALINIVFLMLIFFLVAGTLARPLDPGLTLVRTADLEGRAPADALVIHADGRLSWQGIPVASPSAFLADLPQDMRPVARLLPDRDLPAANLVALGRAVQAAGAARVVIVTERGLE
ncbi:Biopolymer transport protein (plasmid) [Marinovum algicola DG 898]|nr:Biopolymer transport protein [Marinovum algicola DG 898]